MTPLERQIDATRLPIRMLVTLDRQKSGGSPCAPGIAADLAGIHAGGAGFLAIGVAASWTTRS